MRVGNEMVYLEEGKSYVFDDSFEHEVFFSKIYTCCFKKLINRLGMMGKKPELF